MADIVYCYNHEVYFNLTNVPATVPSASETTVIL